MYFSPFIESCMSSFISETIQQILTKIDNSKCDVMYNDTKLLHGNIKIDYTWLLGHALSAI
jgi:hypothetical protein